MNELNEKLKVVAEYMGYKTLYQKDGIITMEDELGYAGHINTVCPKYNESFDCIMPVVQKIYADLSKIIKNSRPVLATTYRDDLLIAAATYDCNLLFSYTIKCIKLIKHIPQSNSSTL